MKTMENPVIITVLAEGRYILDEGEETFVFCVNEKELDEILESEGRERFIKELLESSYDLKRWYVIRKIRFQYPNTDIEWTWEL